MNDPIAVTLYERPPCRRGCPGCPQCRPQLVLSPEAAAAVAATGLVTVTPTTTPGVFALATNGKVGTVAVDELHLRVEAKTPISHLLWMMGYARNPAWWSQHTALVGTDTELVPALAEAYARAADQAVATGLLSGYREVEDSAAVLHGRLRVGEQITRRFGLGLPVEIRYDEYDQDIPENQLLLAATIALLSLPSLPQQLRNRLARLRQVLADVTLPVRGTEPTWTPTRLNRRYHWALYLAELILDHRSVEYRAGSVRIRGFVLDMWKVFEDFLITATAESIGRHGDRGVRPGALEPRRYLDDGHTVTLKPDLTWLDARGTPVTVIDAKYKLLGAGTTGTNADIYQMVAYCTGMNLREAHLVYAQGEIEPRALDIIGSDITIECHALDLTLPPALLLASVGSLIDTIRTRRNAATR
ncbi:McrC family protein [Rhodococcus wratislaviensis]|uniref:McrC family protein n=1 Tax=Rhodococcus wratislaviensis TaxID=44752 RepID=UPI0012DD9A9E|nr:restriction endonuclease [Rhodococcus wratislaviensis]